MRFLPAAGRRVVIRRFPGTTPERTGQAGQIGHELVSIRFVVHRRRTGPWSSTPPADTLPPELADHPDYEILRELGRGGMGVVYLAKNKLMGRPEVLKVVGSHLIERPGVARPFPPRDPLGRQAAPRQYRHRLFGHPARREPRAGDGVRRGARPGQDGQDQGPLPVAHACYFVHQAALGLQHAHERGMVHRDIKPANLILARDGKKAIVKVLDFGLAKVTSEGQADSALTREGQMLGTPDYIAPEQIRDAQSADIRADIYSLGCTFYYLLTGGPPFRGDHLWDLYQAHFSMDAGPLNLVRPEVPVELAAVVAKMMAKEPGRRFQTPGEVAQALTPFFKKSGEGARVSSADMSLVVQQERQPLSPGGDPRPVESGPNVTQAPVHSLKRRDHPRLAQTQSHRSSAPIIAVTDRRKPRWLWPAAAAGVLLLGCVFAWGVIIRVKTSNGIIEFVDLPAGARSWSMARRSP